MYKIFQTNNINETLNHINNRIRKFNLSLKNENGYKNIRKLYNQEKNPLDLFVLIAYSFNHQIRFNSNHEFNNPFGKERSSFNDNMKNNLQKFIIKLQKMDAEFSSKAFNKFNFSILNENDFVYCDPPYLITTGTYNDGKRGFSGWTENEEKTLLNLLDKLNQRGIKFALSNVLEHKGKTNIILKEWIKNNADYKANFISSNYNNSNYQTSKNQKSVEVLITNYKHAEQKILIPSFYSKNI